MNEYKKYQEKMKKFNAWEIDYNRKLSQEESLRRFDELYKLKKYIPESILEKRHQEHLDSLIEVQKKFKSIGSKQ